MTKSPSFLLRRAALCVFAAVLMIRLLVLARLADSPFLLPSRGDMHFYDEWARRILAGQWSDHLAFYGLPGYAFLLAFIYKVCGSVPFMVLLLQAAIDAGTGALIFLIGRRVAHPLGTPAAAIAGSLAAVGWCFFVPAQTFAAVLMPTAWITFVFWLVVWRITDEKRAPNLAGWWILGLLLGLSATVIATILFLCPLLLAAIWFRPGSTGRKRGIATVLIASGIIFGTAPCWAHNLFVARDAVLLSAHGGINFWIGNNPTATGYPHFPPGLRAGQTALLRDSITMAEQAAGHSLTRGEVSQYWSEKAWAYIRHNPVAWLRLLLLKLRNFWNAFQYDDLSVVTNLREQRVTFPGLYFGLVAAFGLAGLAFARRSRARPERVRGDRDIFVSRIAWWIVAAVALQMVSLLPVFTTERYRLPVVPGLLVLGSAGLVAFCLQVQQYKVAGVRYLVVLALATVVVSWPQRNQALWALDYYNSGWQALESGDLPLAERKLESAHRYVPNNAETNFALGNLKLAQHDSGEAARFYLAVLQLEPRHAGALNNLGVLALESGRPELAEQHFRSALALDETNAKTHFLLAETLLADHDYDHALSEVDRAISLNPAQSEFAALRKRITDQPAR